MGKLGSRRVSGSGVSHPLDAAQVGAVERELPLQVTVVLRPRTPRAHAPGRRCILPSVGFCRFTISRIGTIPATIESSRQKVRGCAWTFGGRGFPGATRRRSRRTAEQFARAFGVTLQWFEAEDARYYAYDERVQLPRALRAVTENVLGLENIPTHRTHAGAARGDAHAPIPTLERSMLPRRRCTRSPDRAPRVRRRLLVGGHRRVHEPPRDRRAARDAGVRSRSRGQHGGNAPLDRAVAARIARDWKSLASVRGAGKRNTPTISVPSSLRWKSRWTSSSRWRSAPARPSTSTSRRAASMDGDAGCTPPSAFQSAAYAERTRPYRR